jgi:hypothetical protein
MSSFDRSTIHICANGGVRGDRLCIDRLPLDSGQILLVFFYDVLHAPLHHILRDDDGGSHSECKHGFSSLLGFHCNLDGFLRLHNSTSVHLYLIRDSCVVEMVLLGFPLCMDSLWTDSISVRGYFR